MFNSLAPWLVQQFLTAARLIYALGVDLEPQWLYPTLTKEELIKQLATREGKAVMVRQESDFEFEGEQRTTN